MGPQDAQTLAHTPLQTSPPHCPCFAPATACSPQRKKMAGRKFCAQVTCDLNTLKSVHKCSCPSFSCHQPLALQLTHCHPHMRVCTPHTCAHPHTHTAWGWASTGQRPAVPPNVATHPRLQQHRSCCPHARAESGNGRTLFH